MQEGQVNWQASGGPKSDMHELGMHSMVESSAVSSDVRSPASSNAPVASCSEKIKWRNPWASAAAGSSKDSVHSKSLAFSFKYGERYAGENVPCVVVRKSVSDGLVLCVGFV